MEAYPRVLYFNSLVYYVIMFVCPFAFANECGEGLNPMTHGIYALYSLATICSEVALVLKI